MVSTVACEKSVSNRSAFFELGAVLDAGTASVSHRQLDHGRVVLDAGRPGAALSGGDHGPTVARAEIDDVVGARDLSHVEHLVDERVRRRHPDNVLARLSDLGLEVHSGLSCGRSEGDERRKRGQPHPTGQ